MVQIANLIGAILRGRQKFVLQAKSQVRHVPKNLTVKLLGRHVTVTLELVRLCKMDKLVSLRTGSVTLPTGTQLFASPNSVAAPIIAKLAVLVQTKATLEMEENVLMMQIVVLVSVILLLVKFAVDPGKHVMTDNMNIVWEHPPALIAYVVHCE